MSSAEVVQQVARPPDQAGDAGASPDSRLHLRAVPVELAEANALVSALHRHHKPTVGHRFSIGVTDEDGVLHGAAIVGRPVARLAGHPRAVLEVVRLVTDGTPNACSILYAAAARTGKALGFERIQTYILEDEPGTSLRAAGWSYEGPAGGGDWNGGPGSQRHGTRRTDQPMTLKGRWAKSLNPPQPDDVRLPDGVGDDDAPSFDFGEAS